MATSDAGTTVYAPHGMVASVDHLASSAGVALLRAGGSAADAAVGASAVLAVTTQHMCGMGGDLLAVIHDGGADPVALAAIGRAGSGADAAEMRAAGLTAMPMREDVRSATVPGCVDGWLALHARYGRLPLAQVLAAARDYAAGGFPASPLLARATRQLAPGLAGAGDYLAGPGVRPGDRIRRPLVAATLDAIVSHGRDGFYGGAFGQGLLELGGGLFAPQDLQVESARWEVPLRTSAWAHDLWTMPPPSQGYLTLAGASIAAALNLPDDPADPGWAHLLSEAARWAGHDRNAVLFDGARGADLLAAGRLAALASAIDPARRTAPAAPSRSGGTIHLCVVDADRMGVSLTQSNAAGWGCHLVVPGAGIFLHNRGIGFSLSPGDPAELRPGERPVHTLSPALVTGPDGLAGVLGTMGGDIQPQVLLQLLARLLRNGQTPGEAVTAARWTLGEGGFDSWAGDGPQVTTLESGAPEAWAAGLTARGHRVTRTPPGANAGHAQVIMVRADGMLAGAADPRALTGSATSW
jgi:gamma-glutamyltranspeptidase/glutathione hydrolase